MFGKSFATLGSLTLAGAWLAGGFDASYERVVGASPDEVRAALLDLDVREAPGEPATDPSRSRGIAPTFVLTQQGNDMVWTVMSRNDVAVRMIAHLEPVDGGKRTRVTASIERGNAPDDFVAPAFRSAGVTLGLFGIVLDSELDELVAPPPSDPATCQRMMDEFAMSNFADADMHSQDSLGDAVGDTAKTAMKLAAMEGKLKAAGCSTSADGFEPVSNQMGSGGDWPAASGSSAAPGEVSFEPGKPMVDVSRDSSRR